DVGPDRPGSVQGRVDELLAVHEEPHRLPDVDVVERGLVDAHGKGGDRPGVGLDGPHAPGGGEGRDLRAFQGARAVDDAGRGRVLQGSAVAEVDDRHRVDVGE